MNTSLSKAAFNKQMQRFQEFIVDSLDKYDKKIAEAITNLAMNSNFISETSINIEKDYFDNAINFPNILKKSILISLHSFLESTLQIIGEDVTNICSLTLTKQNGESDIAFYVKLIKAGIKTETNWSKERELYIEIEKNRNIRNCLIHSNGNILKSKNLKTLKNIFELDKEEKDRDVTPALLIDLNNEIVIYDGQYLINYSETIRVYCNLMFDKLGEIKGDWI